MSCDLFHDETKNKTLLALSNGHTVYKGYKPNTENNSIRTMLVLHNKKTGKVRLIEAERWQVSTQIKTPINENNNMENHDMEKKDEESEQIELKKFKSRKSLRNSELSKNIEFNNDVKKELEETISSKNLYIFYYVIIFRNM